MCLIRVVQAVLILKEVGETVPSNVQQAHDFLRWLDRAQFSQLQCALENDVALEGSARRLKSLIAAYQYASEDKVVVQRRIRERICGKKASRSPAH